jgi:hypothetical protein
MTKKDSVAVTGAKENRNKTSRTLNWLPVFVMDPASLIMEMADELLKQKKWFEDNHYLWTEIKQGDVAIIFYVSVSRYDGENDVWVNAMADISVNGQGYVNSDEYLVMTNDEDGNLQFNFEVLFFFKEIKNIIKRNRITKKII